MVLQFCSNPDDSPPVVFQMMVLQQLSSPDDDPQAIVQMMVLSSFPDDGPSEVV
jgi:hypothetical protein